MTSYFSIFEDGRLAGLMDESKSSNPYPKNTWQWDAWLDGWQEGFSEF